MPTIPTVSCLFFRIDELTSRVKIPTPHAEIKARKQIIRANMNQPRSSPVLVPLAEKKRTAGITKIPTNPPPIAEPTRA